jgi:hypothetical protein
MSSTRPEGRRVIVTATAEEFANVVERARGRAADADLTA